MRVKLDPTRSAESFRAAAAAGEPAPLPAEAAGTVVLPAAPEDLDPAGAAAASAAVSKALNLDFLQVRRPARQSAFRMPRSAALQEEPDRARGSLLPAGSRRSRGVDEVRDRAREGGRRRNHSGPRPLWQHDWAAASCMPAQ